MVDSKGGFINEESAESSSTKSMDEWISRQKDAQPRKLSDKIRLQTVAN